MALQKNQQHTVTIEAYSSEGLGIARIDGQVVFVHGGVRGETCVIHIVKVLKNIAFARVAEFLTPSPVRIAPDCPHYAACGGCQLRHITYEEELEAKRQKVEDALRRIGKADIRVGTILGSKETLRYRNKSQFPIDANGQIGFYRARTHQVIAVKDCLLQSSAANAIADALREYMHRFHVNGYNESNGKGLLRHLYVRTNRLEQALVCLVVNGKKLPHEENLVDMLRERCSDIVGIVLNSNTKDTNVILGDRYRTLWGKDKLEDVLCGHSFSLSVPSFYQVNRAQAERLYEKGVEFAALTGEELVLELYCGTGTITLTMAPHAKKVIGAEIVPEAIEDAQKNAAANGIENVEFICADASDIAAKLFSEGLRPDVVVVDPPRKGLAEDVVHAIAAMEPQRIVYISCDCATLARDSARFAPQGYRLENAVAVDLFPRTMHVETAALFVRDL